MRVEALPSATVPLYAIPMRLGGMLLAVCVLGCHPSDEPSLEATNPDYIADTSGLVWGWECSDEEGYCRLSGALDYWDAFGCPENEHGYIFFFPGYLQLCLSCGTPAATEVDDCRYVACAEDADCPQLTYYSVPRTYACVQNLCMNEEDPGLPVSGANAENLCVAEWPRAPGTWFDEAYLELEAEVNATCPNNAEACAVPEDCWPPDAYVHPGPPEWDEGEVVITFEP